MGPRRCQLWIKTSTSRQPQSRPTWAWPSRQSTRSKVVIAGGLLQHAPSGAEDIQPSHTAAIPRLSDRDGEEAKRIIIIICITHHQCSSRATWPKAAAGWFEDTHTALASAPGRSLVFPMAKRARASKAYARLPGPPSNKPVSTTRRRLGRVPRARFGHSACDTRTPRSVY